MNLINETIHTLKKYRFKPSRMKGQHFLVSETVLNRIVLLLNLQPGDVLIDIGAGLGIIALFLAKKSRAILALEHDPLLFQVLQEKTNEYSNIIPIKSDARKFNYNVDNINSIINIDIEPYQLKLLGNLPYYATHPIISQIQKTGYNFSKLVFLLQKEVAEKLAAPTGLKVTGFSSLKCSLYWKMKLDQPVHESAFLPKPHIKSRLLTAIPNHPLPLPEKLLEKFLEFLAPLFQQKRKKLKNILVSNNYTPSQILTAKSILNHYNHSLDDRPEKISLHAWIKLFQSLINPLSNS